MIDSNDDCRKYSSFIHTVYRISYHHSVPRGVNGIKTPLIFLSFMKTKLARSNMYVMKYIHSIKIIERYFYGKKTLKVDELVSDRPF